MNRSGRIWHGRTKVRVIRLTPAVDINGDPTNIRNLSDQFSTVGSGGDNKFLEMVGVIMTLILLQLESPILKRAHIWGICKADEMECHWSTLKDDLYTKDLLENVVDVLVPRDYASSTPT